MWSYYLLTELTLQCNEYEQESVRRKINSNSDIMRRR